MWQLNTSVHKPLACQVPQHPQTTHGWNQCTLTSSNYIMWVVLGGSSSYKATNRITVISGFGEPDIRLKMLTNLFAHVCTIYTGALGQAEKHVLIYLGSKLISRNGNCVMKSHNSGWPSEILWLICLMKN